MSTLSMIPSRTARFFPLSLPFLLLACTATQPNSAAERPAAEPSVRPGANDRFLAQDLDVQEFVGIFEGESREIAASRDRILAALGIEAGMDVADIGAGTGLFLAPFAESVGGEGTLFAVDISPGFIAHLEERVASEGLSRVEVVQSSERSCELTEGSVDLAFLCDTYHHVEYPRSTLWSLFQALRPGGTLVIVDFERIPDVSREWVIGHVRAGKDEVRAEIEEIGFVFEDEVEVPGLEENYFVRFRRP